MLIETDLCLSPEEIWVRIKVQYIMNVMIGINAEIYMVVNCYNKISSVVLSS